MTDTITITVDRGTNSMATSFLVWAKYRAFPECDGDGVFVGELEIGAADSSVSYEWTPPNGNTNWGLIALPKYLDQVGIPGRLGLT